MESVSEALKRLADGASCEGFPTDARELRQVEKKVAELIAADEEFDAAWEIYEECETQMALAAHDRAKASTKRRAAALLACKGQDHER